MVLSDRFGGKPPPSLLKRTLLYVLGFGLGALLVVTVLGFAMVSIAEGVLPQSKDRADKSDPGTPVKVIGSPKDRNKRPAGRAGSNADEARANEAADSDEADDQPL